MAKFAVYYIPPPESDLYQRGSEILGYDVRTGRFLPADNPTRAALPEFDETWVLQPQTYGFHVTTGYALYYDVEQLPQIEQAMEDVFNCFSAGVPFAFTPATERIAFWRDNICVLHMVPNPAMLMLHTMLIARVNPYGTASNISRSYAGRTDLDPVRAHRVRQYYTPYILDGWAPHFTLMMPYEGKRPKIMQQALLDLFSPEPVAVNSICLVVRDDDEGHYRLHREFMLSDYPQPL
ncbi:hypothetical protein G4Y79_10180 [Phototrophicus methaneseepsis]|uniref:DUF1045 domain-containing protein n=1 Tax=Phototrophicus methaneseepsis TaxID=2710758 RepID=A0A7S8IFG8_9CHLR|nr:DUF1045 domain-containing protein [Phototrophicus methaneseepsis]QPC84720.1 hypothetical protein G4Y79_10180 [Phototrophicus methaneseepsis]